MKLSSIVKFTSWVKFRLTAKCWANLTSLVHSTNFTATQLHFRVSENFTNRKRARVKGENPSILALVFLFGDMSTSPTRYAFAMLKLDILPFALRTSIRYEINPSRFWHISPVASNAKAYRAVGISSCLWHIVAISNISKIPQGIYLDAWYSFKSITLYGKVLFILHHCAKRKVVGIPLMVGSR